MVALRYKEAHPATSAAVSGEKDVGRFLWGKPDAAGVKAEARV
jgi:hypothetical protein